MDTQNSSNGNVPPINMDHVESMYRNWYLDYASYVILDRAVPYAIDGLKPVQRRILHSLEELDDGRFHKVANVIGHTMKYHPHGDAAINDALVNLGQKDLLVETQGNWGNPITGDKAAAARYIEARLSKFALEVLFNPAITEWSPSYDGRSKEPVFFPVRFPLLLAQGVEGIAVGLSTKILPHNFCELLKASIDIIKGKKPKIYPDFPSGGIADISEYNDGKKGGRIKVRATINVIDKKTLKISEIPFGTTTGSLIDSIVSAVDKGKIKIKKVEDNTAKDVEVLLHLAANSGTPQQTIDALYAFTDCETSISPNCCVILDNTPRFMRVNELLQINTEHTRELLRQDLKFRLAKQQEKLHFATVEKIFISKRIYRVIEDCDTWEDIIEQITQRLKPYSKLFSREVTREDVEKLTEIRVKRISRYDSKKADEEIAKLEKDIKELKKNLKNLDDFTIDFFEKLLKDYGQGRERKTKLDTFSTVSKGALALPANKLYANLKDGFIGTGLKKHEYLFDITSVEEVIAFTEDGKFTVLLPKTKDFIGKGIVHVRKYVRGDERSIYHLIYRDGKSGPVYAKRFAIPSITRNKTYDLTRGKPGSKVYYLSAHPNGEEETVTVHIHPKSKARKKTFDFSFTEMPVKNRNVVGEKICEYPLQKVEQSHLGETTLEAQTIWFDSKSRKLSTQETDNKLGDFHADDKVLVIYRSGEYEVTDFALNNVYGAGILKIKKLSKDVTLSAVYFDGERGAYYVKRFKISPEETNERIPFIAIDSKTKLNAISLKAKPILDIEYNKSKSGDDAEEIDVKEFVEIRKINALGNKISERKAKRIEFL